MAQQAGRTAGMFSTHRGRKVRNVAALALLFAFFMMFANGLLNGDDTDTSAEGEVDESGMEVEYIPPEVEPSPVDPFNLDNDPEPVSAPESGTSESSLFQSAVTTAGETAQRYATYSHQQAAEDYIGLIPHLSEDTEEALLEVASLNWADIDARQVTASAVVRGTQPRVVAFDAEEGLTSVSVSVAQEVTDRYGDYTFSRSFLIDMRRVDEEGASRWEVIGVDAS